MSDVLPEVFRKSRRGVCPTCGAPLKLAESGRNVRCAFCGGDCSLEHRLRRLEPEVDGLEAPSQAPGKGATRWLKLQGKREACQCPGCGNEFETRSEQSIQRCPFCGSESKLEARLVALRPGDVQGPQRRTRADLQNQQRGRLEYPWDIGTEQLCWRILNEPGLKPRMSLAAEFENWGRIHLTTARFLPHLLRHALTDHEGVARGICDAIGKLLCSDDANYAVPVLQACAGVVFEPGCKRAVLSELALGRGVCIKLLLDAAEAAAARGDRDQACHALWGVNTIFGRNFDQHEVMAEIILYRMFYLTGTVLGWAVYIMQSGFHAGYKLPWPKLVRALDDFAAERPELVPELRKCFYVGPAKAAAEYRARLDALRAVGPVARAAAGRILGAPPGDDGALALEALELLHPLLDLPEAGPWALMAMRGVIKGCDQVPESVRQFVKQNLATLPMEIKRELRWSKADEGILPPEESYRYSSDPRDEPTPELQAMLDDWDAGIRAAVAAYRGESDALRPLRDEAKRLDVPIFLDEKGETLPVKDAPAPEPPTRDKPAESHAPPPRVDRITRESMRLQEAYAAKVTKLAAQLQKPGVSTTEAARISRQMMELGQELQRDMQQLFESQD